MHMSQSACLVVPTPFFVFLTGVLAHPPCACAVQSKRDDDTSHAGRHRAPVWNQARPRPGLLPPTLLPAQLRAARRVPGCLCLPAGASCRTDTNPIGVPLPLHVPLDRKSVV